MCQGACRPLQYLLHNVADTVTRYYQLNFLKTIFYSVPLMDESVATILILDVKAILVAFLNDLL
jgi:hypothetical protein